LIERIGSVVGDAPSVQQGAPQPGDVERTLADLTRARDELGYAPTTSLEARSVADMSPIFTIGLLQVAEVLPAGSAGVEAYRNDRDPDAPWNDPYGNPLVVGCFSFLAPRTDGYQVPRDRIYRAYRQTYGTGRAVSFAIGAAGRRLRTSMPSEWSDIDTDKSTLRALWTQILDVTKASEWNETAFDDSPWNGLRAEDAGRERCYLSEPFSVE